MFLLVCVGQIGVQFGWYSPQSGVVCEHEVCEITQALTFILDFILSLEHRSNIKTQTNNAKSGSQEILENNIEFTQIQWILDP